MKNSIFRSKPQIFFKCKTGMFLKGEGFTIIETMAVIGITLFLSATLVIYNRSSMRQLSIFRDQAVIFGVLSRAKSLAVEKYNYPVGGSFISCGFGVRFDIPARIFFIFADTTSTNPTDPNSRCKVGGVYQGNGVFDPGVDPIVDSSSTLGSGTEFEFRDGGGAIQVGVVDIVFVPPDPTATSSAILPNTITIKTPDDSLKAFVKVSESGQITTQ